MNFFDYILLSGLVLIGVLAISAFTYVKIKSRYLAKQTIRISHAQSGHLVLKGKVQKFDKLIAAPLTNELCCGYLYLIEDTSNLDIIVHSENQGTNFILDDGTGRCLIRGKLSGNFYNAKLWPPTIKFSNCSTIEDAIELNDFSTDPRDKRFRYIEYKRQEGEIVYIVGLYQTLRENLNLINLNLNGVIEDTEKSPLTITPAYPGSIIHSSNRGHWLVRIFDGLRIFS